MSENLGTLREVVRDVVAEIAPDELDYVDGLKLLDERVVSRQMRKRRDKREPLGFGPTEIAVLVAPVVWVVVEYAANKVTDSLLDRVAKWVKSRIGRGRAETLVPLEVRTLLTEIHQRTVEEAEKQGQSTENAKALADALIRRLTIGELGELPDADQR